MDIVAERKNKAVHNVGGQWNRNAGYIKVNFKSYKPRLFRLVGDFVSYLTGATPECLSPSYNVFTGFVTRNEWRFLAMAGTLQNVQVQKCQNT